MQEKKLKIRTVILGIVLSILLLGLSQSIAFGISTSLVSFGISSVLGIILSGIMYVMVVLIGILLLIRKLIPLSLEEMRILPVKINFLGIFTALMLPLTVVVLLLVSGGQFEIGEIEESKYGLIVVQSILFYGFAVGIVEELIFRGLVFTLLEKFYNSRIALWIPSILFGALHIFGGVNDVISMIQVVLAGTLVGVLFTLVTIVTKSVWNSALVHGIWNCIFVGNIFHIGEEIKHTSIINYVLSSKDMLITGGDFGVEASIFAILAYSIFAVLFWVKFRKNSIKKIKNI